MDSGRLRKVLIFGLFFGLTAAGGYFLYQQRPAGLPAGFDVSGAICWP
jgi:HlyD family secretion protein